VESKHCDGEYFGYTKNYTPVKIRSNAEVGSIKEVKITDYADDFCIGI
jgi:tRNA A37 methylthiotransferase MiaB